MANENLLPLAGVHSIDLSLLTKLSDQVVTTALAAAPSGSKATYHMAFLIPLTFTFRVEFTIKKPDGSETRIDTSFDLLDIFNIVVKP